MAFFYPFLGQKTCDKWFFYRNYTKTIERESDNSTIVWNSSKLMDALKFSIEILSTFTA